MEDHPNNTIANSDYVQEYWLPTKIAIREVVSFERRFGEKHLLLACHIALPFLFTMEMLNLININFLDHESIPWFAEADFLLSPLCRQIDDTLFEIEPRVREVLLVKLEKRFGHSRLLDIADFLLVYIARSQELQMRTATVTTLRWIALSYLMPDQAITEMTAQLQEGFAPGAHQPSKLLGQLLVTTTIDMITEPLEQTTLQHEYNKLLYNSYFLAKFLYTSEEAIIDKEIDELSKSEHHRIIDGNLQLLGFQSILKMLAVSRRSGKLSVSSGPETLSISLRKGQIVELYEDGIPQPDLLGMLCLIGRLDPIRAQTIREMAQGDMQVALMMLVKRGWMNAAEMQTRLEFAVTQSTSHALRWINGRFAFHRQLVPMESRMQPLDVDSILLEALHQADEWEEVANANLMRTTVVRWLPDISRDVRSLGLNQESIETLCLANGTFPLQAISLVLMMPEAKVARIMNRLLELNLIEVVDPALEIELQQDLSNIIIKCQYTLTKQRKAKNADQYLLGLITTLAECINGLLIHHGRYARSLRGRSPIPPIEIVRYLERRFTQTLQLLARQQYPILDITTFAYGQLDCEPVLDLNKIVKGDQLEEFHWEAVQGLTVFLRLIFTELLRNEVGNSHTGSPLNIEWRIFLSEVEHEMQQYQAYRAHHNTHLARSHDVVQFSPLDIVQNEGVSPEKADASKK